MNKEQKSAVVEYISSLSEEALKFHAMRLTEKFSGDLAESLNELSKDKRIDSVLGSAESADELFSLLDQVRELILKECKKKGLHLKMSTGAA
jgi:hypothetical protein